jgi:hypothetical protein
MYNSKDVASSWLANDEMTNIVKGDMAHDVRIDPGLNKWS